MVLVCMFTDGVGSSTATFPAVLVGFHVQEDRGWGVMMYNPFLPRARCKHTSLHEIFDVLEIGAGEVLFSRGTRSQLGASNELMFTLIHGCFGR